MENAKIHGNEEQLFQKILGSIPNVGFAETIDNRRVFLFPGNRFWMGMGCKFFRFWYFLNQWKNRKNHPNLPLGFHGNLHSNYMAAMAYFSNFYKIPVQMVAYNRYHQESLNSQIVRRFSKSLQILGPKEYHSQEWQRKLLAEWVPSYGMDPNSGETMNLLWDRIPWNHFTHVVLDVGSGMSFMSLYKYLRTKNFPTQILGVCIGSPKETLFQSWIRLGMEFQESERERLIFWEPILGKKFSKIPRSLLEYIVSKSKVGIHLEPIYSAKTYYTIEKNIHFFPKESSIVYIHQGGNLNWFHLYL